MGLFGAKKKNNDQLRTLSEKEIQDRLYGSFRMNHDTTIRHEARAGSSGIAVESLPTPKATTSPVETRRQSSVIDKRKEAERIAHVSEWADEETDLSSKAAKLGWMTEQSSTRPLPAARPAQPRKPVLVPLIKTFVREVVQLLRSLAAPSRQTRRNTSWIITALLLLAVFLGIHFLNSSREQAMKAPRRADGPIPVVAKKTDGVLTPATDETRETALPLSSASDAEKLPPQPQTLIPEGRFVIQVCTYSTETDAEQLVTRIEREKFPAFVKSMGRSGGKIYHLVFIGRFKERDEAKKAMAEFQKKDIARSFKDAFVRTL